MLSCNYFRIFIIFHLMLYLLGVYKNRFTADHLYISFDFALSLSINCGTGINHSQVAIFIHLMSWYRGSIITDAEGIPRVDYPIAFYKLLTKIHQLEEDHAKLVSRLNLKTNKLVEGEFDLLIRRSKVLTRQEDYAVAFTVVAKKVYEIDYLAKVKESFSGLSFERLYYSTAVGGDLKRSLSHCTDRVFSYDKERKRLRQLGQVIENSIVVARLYLEISSYTLPILVLLEVLNTPEVYAVAFQRYPFWKHGKSKSR